MRVRNLFMVMALFVLFDDNAFSQKEIVFDTNYVKEKSINWIDYAKAPDFILESVQMSYNEEWICMYSLNEIMNLNSKTYYIFTINRTSVDDKYENLTYVSSKIEDHFYVSYLIVYSTNYMSGLNPTKEVHSVLNDGIFSIYSESVLIESFDTRSR